MEESIINLYVSEVADCSNVKISIENGKAINIGNCKYELVFHRSRGGRTILFGKVIKNSSPEYTNDVKVSIDNEIIKVSNYVKLNGLEMKTLDGERFHVLPLDY
jgi:hypothetical protein